MLSRRIPWRGFATSIGCVILFGAVWCKPVDAGQAQAAAAELRLEQDIAHVVREIADAKVFDVGSCAAYLTRNTRFLVERGAEDYLPRTAAEWTRLEQQTPRLLQEMFRLRLVLLERLREFADGGAVDQACIDAVRRALRYGRFVEESLAEYITSRKQVELPRAPLQGQPPSYLVNPAYPAFKLRTGDILLARSSSFVGAAIARIGDEDGQFSHLALVYVAADGRTFVIESLITSGIAIVPLEEWMEHEQIRLVVLRHGDRLLAEKAARALHDWVKEQQKNGVRVAYDYVMNSADYSAMYCSEVVRFAYDKASEGAVILPAYQTSLAQLHGQPFLESLGITSLLTFAPADAEIDPRLHLVAEWRDLRNTADTRIQDAVITSVLEWMATHGYQLTYQGLVQGAIDVYWRLLRPLGLGKRQLPDELPKAFLKNVVGLHLVAEKIFKGIKPSLKKKLQRNPLALDYREVLAAIEEYRRQDCEKSIQYHSWRYDHPLEITEEDQPVPPELHQMIRSSTATGCHP